MAAMGQLSFSVFVIFSQLLTVTVGRRYGQPAKTLHMAKELAQDVFERGFHYINVPKEDFNGDPAKAFSRHKRSITNGSSSAPQIASVVSTVLSKNTVSLTNSVYGSM